MPRVELTKSNIDALKPAAYRYTAWDTEMSGFGLRLTPNGRRVYVLKYLSVVRVFETEGGGI